LADIKPEDILFATPDGDRIRLVDFGLAHKMKPGEKYISEYGSPEFVSPEIVNKLPITSASDMWSLGTMTYLLLSGRSPFLGETDRDTLLSIQSGVWNFDHYFAGISDEARDFISKLLKSNPSERLSAETALSHPWLMDRQDQDYVRIDSQSLQKYQRGRRQKLVSSVVHKFARFKPLHAAITHPQVFY
jgi:myosin-light-chain kinase